MIPIAKLKQNLDFNKNLGDLIEIMKLAATIQFNQFRSRQEPYLEFLSSLEAAFNSIPQHLHEHPFLKARQNLPSVLVLVTSDEGFLGELSSLLVNKLTDSRRPGDKVITLGRQGADYLSDLKAEFIGLPSVEDKLEFSQVEKLREEILNMYAQGGIGKVIIIYPHFVNIAVQQVQTETLLPMTLPPASSLNQNKEMLIEPNADLVIKGWVKLWLGFRLYQIFWSSKLAEFSARIMHLEGSVQELNDKNRHLKLEYFKYIHGLSDKAIREISASRFVVRR